MLGIIRKDLLFTLGYLLLLPLMLAYWFMTRRELDTTAVFMMSAWIYIVTFGSMTAVEMNELKSRGYLFLRTLPVTPLEIVAGKLIPVFVQAAVYAAVLYFAFAVFESSPEWLAFARSWLVFNSTLAMVLTACVYWVTFRYGFEKGAYLVGFLLMLGFISPIFFNELMIRGYIDRSAAIFRFTGDLSGVTVAFIGTAVFLVLSGLSVRAVREAGRT